MAAAETVKNTVEQAANATKQTAAAGNEALKQGMDKSINAMTELNAINKANVEAMVESATVAARGAAAISTQSFAFSKSSWEKGVSAAQALAGARSIQEVIELQTSFAKTSMEAYLAEVTKLTDTMQASVKDTFKPINERVTATVERVQSVR